MSPARKLRHSMSLLALLLLMTGCGGFSASKSISPIDFLLPGAGGLIKADPVPAHPDSDHPIPVEKPVVQVAKL
jgi:hypothetical protein